MQKFFYDIAGNDSSSAIVVVVDDDEADDGHRHNYDLLVPQSLK